MKYLLVTCCSLVFLAASSNAQAHKRWLLPNDFTLSDPEPITIDYSASNNVFFVDHPMPMTGVEAFSPSGIQVNLINGTSGMRRSTFDVEINEIGTYRILAKPPPVFFVSYTLPDKSELYVERGPLNSLKAQVPANASDVNFSESRSLIETYVTLGAISRSSPKTDLQGISLDPISHPNELYSDEPASFRLLLDGKPLSGAAAVLVPEGSRYRDGQGAITVSSDELGKLEIKWPAAGRYLLEVALEHPQPDQEISMMYFNYFLTLEVMAP